MRKIKGLVTLKAFGDQGSGKTTLLQEIEEYMSSLGYKTSFSEEHHSLRISKGNKPIIGE